MYLASINKDRTIDDIEESHYSRMRNAAALVHEEVSTQAYFQGMAAVYTATQVLENETQVVPLFNESFENYVAESFPREENGLTIAVDSHFAGLFYSSMHTNEIVTTHEEEDITLKGKDTEVKSQTIKNDKAGEFNKTSSLSYYMICGHINYTIRDGNSARFLKKNMLMERRIESAFPLLDGKLEALKTGSQGTASPLSRTVKYILTTLAQFRVLSGYGMGTLPSVALNLPDKKTNQILTQCDIELALNLALLLETARHYRTYDMHALQAIDDNFENTDDEDYDKVNDRGMEELVKNYVTNGTVDPADLITLYLGVENRKLNLEAIFAQALNAVADQFILKYMDYFHLMDIYDGMFAGVQSLAQTIVDAGHAVGDFFGWTKEGSSDEENYQRVKDWVTETIRVKAGHPETRVMHDTSISIPQSNYPITLTKEGVCGHWEDTDNDPQTPDEYVEYAWTTTLDYEIQIGPGNYHVDFIEMNLFRDDVKNLWYDSDSSSDFHDTSYGESTNDIYENIREVVKAVIGEVVKEITSVINLDLTPFRTLARPDNLNPKDDVSLLEEVENKVNDSLVALSEHFSEDEGRENLRDLITKLVDDQANGVAKLQVFIEQHFDEFAQKDDNIQSATESLAAELIHRNSQVVLISQTNDTGHPQCIPQPVYSVDDVQALFDLYYSKDVEDDITDSVSQAYDNVKSKELSYDEEEYIIGALQNSLNGTGNTIIDLFTNAIWGFGLIPMACAMVRYVLNDMIYDSEMANTKFLGYTKVGVPFEFWEDEYEVAKGEGKISYESLAVDQKPNYLSKDDDLDITISSAKGTHYTSLGTFSTKPFVTRWDVTISGAVELETRTSSRLFLSDGTHEYTKNNGTIDLDISLTVTVYSGWNLEGVDYDLTNDLLGDICAFLNMVWEFIASIVGAVYDALMKIVESVVNLITQLISYATKIIEVIVDTIQFFVKLLEDFIQSIVDSIVMSLIEAVTNLIKNGLSISAFGITFTIKGNLDVARNTSADGDLLTVSTVGNVVGTDLNFTLRFARYHTTEDEYPHYDILLDSIIQSGDFKLNFAVDPLMKINSYIVEGHGMSQPENETGWGIDFYVPEVEEYKEVRYCLSNVAKGMNSIPIPPLGLKATVDCGFIIQYNEPRGDSLVINEFELNPKGDDNGSEWFEIYNPNGNSTDGWMVKSAWDGTTTYLLSDLASESNGLYTVYLFPNETLENGNKTIRDSKGDGLVLLDEEGKIIDETPVRKDPGEGDDKTWQRRYDGSVVWKFNESTKMDTNMPENFNFKTEIIAALKASFNIAFDALREKDLCLDAVIEFVQDWIRTFIDFVIILICDVVQKVYVYLDILIEDASGSAGGGIRLSLGIDTIGLEALLRWLVEAVETFIYNILNPANPESYPSVPKTVPEHMYVRFGVYLQIGTPKIIKKISEGAEDTCTLMIAVQANLPALASLLGYEWGDWEVVFGVFLDHFSSKSLSKSLGTSDDPDAYVDLWLLWGRVYELS